MEVILHLSDLHLRAPDGTQDLVLEKLVEALESERAASAAAHVLVVVTGDVFDSASEAASLVPVFVDLRARILGALGPDTPLIVLPGNHDRRKFGFLGPQRSRPFRDLAQALQSGRTFVAGTRLPFLAQIVPDELHGLPMHVVVYDSHGKPPPSRPARLAVETSAQPKPARILPRGAPAERSVGSSRTSRGFAPWNGEEDCLPHQFTFSSEPPKAVGKPLKCGRSSRTGRTACWHWI
jgi:hypothetical protein